MSLISDGGTVLGIELGSTRIKACLIDPSDARVLATGSHVWESRLVDGHWSYGVDEIWAGLRSAYASLIENVARSEGTMPARYRAIGVSAMMHGYLAFDTAGELLVPFRTWRNTNTGPAAQRLTAAFGENVPLRWSSAHLLQAILDEEPHVSSIDYLTTLAGYVHWKLTGRRVLGVGDASGMFSLAVSGDAFDMEKLGKFDSLAGGALGRPVSGVLPEVLPAGRAAGALTRAGAALLDPSGRLEAGIPLCPPEGDAGTGMVATGAVSPRTGNVSAGTSIFAMVVLERPLEQVHMEIDVVATPAGDPVAMVHCNNGANEIGAWGAMFARFAEALGTQVNGDRIFQVLFDEALRGAPDAGGVVAYNFLAGEPVVEISDGRPLVVRSPDSEFTLANFMRSQLYGAFGALAIGMEALDGEGVAIDRLLAHGGIFRTAEVAQRFLAAALDTPVTVGETAAEGGAWGIAVLAAYLEHAEAIELGSYLREHVFSQSACETRVPEPEAVRGYRVFLENYRAALPAVRAAAVERSATAPALQ